MNLEECFLLMSDIEFQGFWPNVVRVTRRSGRSRVTCIRTNKKYNAGDAEHDADDSIADLTCRDATNTSN